MTNKKVGIELNIAATGTQQLSEVEKGLANTGKQATELAAEASQAAGKLGQLGDAAGDIGRAAQEGARGLDQIETAAQESAAQVGQAAGKLDALGEASTEVGRAAKEGARGFDDLDSAAQNVAGQAAQAAGKLGQLERAADDAGRAAQGSARAFDQIDTAAKGAADELGEAAGRLGDLGRASGEVGRVAQDSARDFGRLDDAAKGLAGQATQAAGKLNDLGRASSDTRTQAGELAKALDGVQTQVKQAGSTVEALGKDLDGAFRTLGIRAANDVRAEIDKLQTAMARIHATNPFSEDTARAAAALKQRLAELDTELGQLPTQANAAAAGVRNVGTASAGAADAIDQAAKRALALGGALLGINSASDVARSVLDTASAYQTLQIRLEQTLGSQEAANEQFERIKQLAIETPFEVTALTDAYIRLTNFGLKPSMQQMMALADTAAVAGGGTEALSRVTMALGQAWAKTRLQGDEILQLTEAGVPVWDLLAEATGKNVTELQQLATAGALGRDVILKLFDAIGDKNAGASSKLMSTFAGTVSNAKDAMAQFFDMIGKAGVLEYLTKKLQEALTEFDRMKDSGELQRKAEAIAKGFLDMARGVEVAVDALRKLAPLLELALAAWAGSKALDIARDMWAIARGVGAAAAASGAAAAPIATMGASAATAATGVGMLAGAMRALGRVVGIGLAVEALSLLAGKFLDNQRAAEDAAEAARKAAKATNDALTTKPEGKLVSERFEDTKDIIRDVSAELEEFRKKLPQLESDLSGLTGEGLASAAKATIENLRAIKAPADEARKAIGTIAERAAEVLGVELPSQAAKISTTFKGVQAEFSTLVGQLPNLGLTARQQSEIVSQALSKMVESAGTKQDFESLEATIQQLGKAGKISADQLAEALDASAARATKLRDAIDDASPGIQNLREAARRVGVDFDQLTKGVSDGFRKGMGDVRAFHDEVVRSGIAAERASPQLAAALDQQIRTAKTREEIEAARKATEDFRESGKLLGVDYGDALDKIRKKTEEISPALKQAKKDAELLGVELSALSDKPKASVEEMLTAYERLKRGGKASAEELRSAFTSVAIEAIQANQGIVPEWVAIEAKMRDVVMVGEEFGKSSIEWSAQVAGSAGRVTEAVKGSETAYRDMGKAAKAAGEAATEAAREAARAEVERRTIVDSMFGDPAAIAARNEAIKGSIPSGSTALQPRSTSTTTGAVRSDAMQSTAVSTQFKPPDASGDWYFDADGFNRMKNVNLPGFRGAPQTAYQQFWKLTPAAMARRAAEADAFQANRSVVTGGGAYGAGGVPMYGSAARAPAPAAAPAPQVAPTPQLQPITIQIGLSEVTGYYPPGAGGLLERMLQELAAARARTSGGLP